MWWGALRNEGEMLREKKMMRCMVMNYKKLGEGVIVEVQLKAGLASRVK